VKDFNYGSKEFFYDKSFNDYPIKSLFELVEFHLNNTPNNVHINGNFYHKTFNGKELLKFGKVLLQSNEFQHMSENSFLPINAPIDGELRIVQYQNKPDLVPLHEDLKICSISIRSTKVNDRFKATDIYITASFETMHDLDL